MVILLINETNGDLEREDNDAHAATEADDDTHDS